MRYLRFAGAVSCVLFTGAYPVAAQTADNPQPSIAPTPAPNAPVSAALTCGEFLPLVQAKTSGYATIWLDGYYSGRAGLTQLPAGWIRTLSQALGGTCTIDVNAARSVLDVIAQLHREYGGVPH
jgi:hypothetical protein